MKTRFLFLLCMCGLLVGPVNAQQAPKRLVLVSITMGPRHRSIPLAEKLIADFGASSQLFTVDLIQQPPHKPAPPKKPTPLKPGATAEEKAQFKVEEAKYRESCRGLEPLEKAWEQTVAQALQKLSPESLANYDGVVFINTIGELPLPDREGFLEWIQSGKAFIGFHSAADTLHTWPGYIEMLGGEFARHTAMVPVDCINEDPTHPATAHLGNIFPIAAEEMYLFNNYDATRVKELLVLDKHPSPAQKNVPGRFPVSWTREYGRGKVFYTSLGHREDLWDADPAIPDRKNPVEVSEAFQAHALGGIQWALGLETAPTK